MQNVLNDATTILAELAAIKKQLLETSASQVTTEWIPKKALMGFFGYGETQIASLLNSGELIVAVIGKRKFIQRASLMNFLEKNIRS